MDEKSQHSIAASLESETELLPYLPYLVQDLWALGSSVDQILDAIGELNLPQSKINVLDLGCGKGAVSILIAERFGYSVTGIDAMPEFLKVAGRKAEQLNLINLCKFIKDDIFEFTKTRHEFDLVLLASLGGIFGTNKETIARLRTQVKPGGYILIDDGYLKEGITLKRKHYEHYRSHSETINELTAYSDKLIQEINTSQVSKKINEEYLTLIKKRGIELAAAKPELKELITEYVRTQIEECEVIEKYLEGVLWVIEKYGK